MYTPDQIRAAGQAGEISSIDVEHLIKILEEKFSKGVDPTDFKELLYIVNRMCGWINEVGSGNYTIVTSDIKKEVAKIADKYQ